MSKRKHTDDEEDGGEPAYAITGNGSGPSCSCYPADFCFLCSFSSLACGDTDYVEEIEALVTQLAKEKRELPIIARAVSRAYREGPQQWVVWDNPLTKCQVARPDWSKASISRHLLYSGRFRQLFNRTVSFVFERLIHTEQSTVMDPRTGRVRQDQKYNLLKTVAAYADYKLKMARIEALKGGAE